MQITLDTFPDLRDATRALAASVSATITSYLEMTKPHYRPPAVFGTFVAAGQKDSPRDAKANFEQFKEAVTQAVSVVPLTRKLTVPDGVEISFGTPTLESLVYTAMIETKSGPKAVSVSKPLLLVISEPAYPFKRLMELAQMKNPPADEFNAYVIHYTAVNFLLMRAKSVIEFSSAIGFPIATIRLPEFGALPITVVGPKAGTVRPPDSVIAQVIRNSGSDSIEEIFDAESWKSVPNPMLELFHSMTAGLLENTSIAA